MPEDDHVLEIPVSRLDAIREKLESGEQVTELDCQMVAQLQALDVVELGRNFAVAEARAWNRMLVIDEALQEARKREILRKVGLDDSGGTE